MAHTPTQSPDTESLHDILARTEARIFSTPELPAPASVDVTTYNQKHRPIEQRVAVRTNPTVHDLATDYTRIETSLETIGYFQAGYKRTYPKPQEKRVVKLTDGRSIEYYPNATFGYPNTEDQDFYRGFQKICAEQAEMVKRWNSERDAYEYHPRIKAPIRVTTNQWLRAAGKEKSKQNVRALKDFIKRQTLHGISGKLWSAKTKSYTEITASLFSLSVLRGEKLRHGGIADMHYIWPSPIFLSNFYYFYSKQIDLAYYRGLRKPIAKGLWQLLEEGWFAVMHNGGWYFEKSYVDMCALLSIVPRKHLSAIKQQLDPAHRDLSDHDHERPGCRFLEHWEYRPSATNKSDFIIRWYPGSKFFIDQRARMKRTETTEHAKNASKRPALNEDGKLLLFEVVSFCGDVENEPMYYKAVRDNPSTLILRVLADTRLAHREHRITSTKGAYFMDTLKRFL